MSDQSEPLTFSFPNDTVLTEQEQDVPGELVLEQPRVNLIGETDPMPERTEPVNGAFAPRQTPTGAGPGSIPPFKDQPEAKSSSLTHETGYSMQQVFKRSELQRQLDRDSDKAGLCIICSCTQPLNGEHIECSTSPQRMAVCFEEKLGYSLCKVENLSILDLKKLLDDVKNIKIPSNCNKDFRFFFYFFGHGTASEICLSDGNIERSVIISDLQNIHEDKFKIAFFDSCRSVPQDQSLSVPQDVPGQCDLKVNMDEPIQAMGSLPGHSQCVDVPQNPFANTANTLVIYTTDYRGKAYYCVADRDDHLEMKGSGLATYFFTDLAPDHNQPLSVVLTEVRKEVDAFLKKESSKDPELVPQLLVYDDRLMGSVNLLAESKGKVRVKPEVVRVEPSVLTTTFQWTFQLNVDERIKTFRVICQDEAGKSIEVKEKLTLKNVAKFKNNLLEPNTKYHVKVAAVYTDGFEAESAQLPFTTLARVSPSDISIAPFSRGASKATVKWKFQGDTADLEEFCVLVDGKEAKKVPPGGVLEAEIGGLRPATTHNIRVIAVFKDRRETECEINYENDKLEHAEIESVHLTSLSPLKVNVKWQLSPEAQIYTPPSHYRVLSNNKVVVESCDDTHSEIELDLGTPYSFKVETCYTEEVLESKEFPYNTPTADDLKITLEFSETKRNSVTVKVYDPPIFQRQSQVNLRESFRLRRIPVDNEPDIGKYTNHSITRSATATFHEFTLGGNVPGKKYLVKCEMDCTSGGPLKQEKLFSEPPKPCCLQKVYTSRPCALVSYLIFSFIVLSMVFSIIPSLHYLQADNNGATHLALTDAAVQCGGGNSNTHRGINLEGLQLGGDTLQGVFNAWLVRQDDLKLNSRHAGPFHYGYTLLDGERYVQLLGWSEYLWERSVISGFCCVGNLNNTEATASLHLFTDDEDVDRYREGNSAKNYVLSETVTIPPGTEHCFTEWGRNRPFNVTKSSYHFFILKVSENNMNFTSEISLFQTYVNTSDYTDPHQFKYNSHTFFEFPNNYRHPTEYITICQAPSYLEPSHPDAESLHIQSWNSPYYWISVSVAFASFGFVGLIPVLIGFGVICCYSRRYLLEFICGCIARLPGLRIN